MIKYVLGEPIYDAFTFWFTAVFQVISLISDAGFDALWFENSKIKFSMKHNSSSELLLLKISRVPGAQESQQRSESRKLNQSETSNGTIPVR